MPGAFDDGKIDLASVFGALEAPTVERLSIYLPDRDRDSNAVHNIEDWIVASMSLLTDINGGCTRMPANQGEWKSPSGDVVKERTTIIYSYLFDADSFVSGVDKIRAFLHLFGRQTNQGEVLFEFSGNDESGPFSRAYRISNYDQ